MMKTVRCRIKLAVSVAGGVAVNLAAVAQVLAADVPSGVTITPCGLRVVAPAYAGEPMLRAFYGSQGVAVMLRLEHSEGGLVAFDGQASELAGFTDDQGTDLLPAAEDQAIVTGFGTGNEISKDRKAVMVEVTGGTLPKTGATHIHVQGTAVVLRAAEQQTFRQENVKLIEGAVIDAGPFPLTVSKVGKPHWGDAPLAVHLQAKQPLDAIAAYRFIGSDGQIIEAKFGGASQMAFGEQVAADRGFLLAKKVDTVTIELDCWIDLHREKVPLDVKVAVGL